MTVLLLFNLSLFVPLAIGEEEPAVFLSINNVELIVPIEGYTPEKLFERSILYYPKNAVRDGLAHFGATRDDWKNFPRLHKGIDIYPEPPAKVLSAADGKVIKTGDGHRAGPFVVINHCNGISTAYIHLSDVSVGPGQKVKKGQVIGTITGATGNAYEPQLHFELRSNGNRVDPIKHALKTHSETEQGARLNELYSLFKKQLPDRKAKRKQALKEMRNKKE